MACSNCFNGCADIISDKCVKYTGVDIPSLGISTGDTLLTVENQITSKLLQVMSGNGVYPVIPGDALCTLVSSFLPSSGLINLNQVIIAAFKSICSLSGSTLSLETFVNTINAGYNVGCLPGVSGLSGVKDVLQAAINKLCQVDTTLNLLTSNLVSNYVQLSQINTYIALYLAAQPGVNLVSRNMVPYAASPYFGPLGFFDITGAGTGDWANIYLCNGLNGTPDLRGRVLVGATSMGTNTYTDGTVTNPVDGNPEYSGIAPFTRGGNNLSYLVTPNQLPPHSHLVEIVINDPQHVHTGSSINPANGSGTELNFESVDVAEHYGVKDTTLASTGITATGTVGVTGASEGHANIQPVHSTNYIIYIP